MSEPDIANRQVSTETKVQDRGLKSSEHQIVESDFNIRVATQYPESGSLTSTSDEGIRRAVALNRKGFGHGYCVVDKDQVLVEVRIEHDHIGAVSGLGAVNGLIGVRSLNRLRKGDLTVVCKVRKRRCHRNGR